LKSTTFYGPILAALVAAAPPAGAQDRDAVDRTLAAARAERGAGRLTEAEYVLRDALHASWSPELGLELGAVLADRAVNLDGTSELVKSLREGTLAEALSIYDRVATDPRFRVEATLGSATCEVIAGRVDDGDARLATLLKSLRESAGPVEPRRRLVQERVRLLASHQHAAPARALIEEAKTSGELDAAGIAFEELVVRAAARDDAGVAEAAAAALVAGAPPFDVAYTCWDGIGSGPGQLEKLLHLYSRLLEIKPAHPALLFYRGFVRLWLKDAAGALEDFKPCLDDPELGARTRMQYGNALVNVNRAEEALAYFEKLAEDPAWLAEAMKGVIGVAISRARARKLEDALTLYREVIAKDPMNGYAHMGEALCLRNLGEYEKASASYEAGIAATPDDPVVQTQLMNDYALMLDAHGEREKAQELYEQALGGGSADAGENLGIIAYRDRHDLELAARYFARTLLLDPKRPRIRFYRELCLTPQSNAAAK
jgi:tetratricopeptide (TPR) repeat protein